MRRKALRGSPIISPGALTFRPWRAVEALEISRAVVSEDHQWKGTQ
jgi:hypothetical protein